MTHGFAEDIALHLKTGYPLIFVLTRDEQDALDQLERGVALANRTLDIRRERGKNVPLATQLASRKKTGSVTLLDDVHMRLSDPDVVRLLLDLAHENQENQSSVIVLAPWVNLPTALLGISAVLDHPLPGAAQIGTILHDVCQTLQVPISSDMAVPFIRVAQGMTAAELTRAFRKAFGHHGTEVQNALASVLKDKQSCLKGNRVLETIDVPPALDDVAGLDRLKSWLMARSDAFSDSAREYGLPAPRGVLLMGIQGCGKSLTAKAIASHWQLPLVRLDIPQVFGSDHPEAVLQEALQRVEAMAPLVLWIDEIEKGFDHSKEGSSSRILGGMITWLQEKQGAVFVVATANRVASIPPELSRKGRLDEIFFVDLPNFQERCDVLTLHLQKRGRDPGQFPIEHLAKLAEHFTGSELEQVIIAGMYSAFSRRTEVQGADLERALRETVPLYETYEVDIKALREWARTRARPASTDRRKADLFQPKN